MKKLFIFFAVILICPSLFANSYNAIAANEFADSGRKIPDELIDLGITQIGRLDIQELAEQIEKVKLNPKTWFVVKGNDGTERISGYWHNDNSDSGIDINLTAWSATPEDVRPVISLHEFLGILGYSDHDYNLSFSLWFLANQSKKKLITEDDLSTVKDNIIKLAEGGGVIGTGGGGDFGVIELKQYVIKENEKIYLSAPKVHEGRIMQAYQFILNTKMEMKWIRKN
ncbi:MAG: hypothetical protein ACXVCP_19045 [Bdellovibrio sp.]